VGQGEREALARAPSRRFERRPAQGGETRIEQAAHDADILIDQGPPDVEQRFGSEGARGKRKAAVGISRR